MFHVPLQRREGGKRVRTDRGGGFDGLHCSLEHLLRQPEVGGATVHDALIVVVLQASGISGYLSTTQRYLFVLAGAKLTSLQSMLRSCPLTSIRTMITS